MIAALDAQLTLGTATGIGEYVRGLAQALRAAGARVSKATVYNTLNLFVDKGLIRELVLAEGRSVFDCNLEQHHHFIDEATGTIHDIPWDALRVSRVDRLAGYEIKEYMVVLRGKRAPGRGKRARHC